MPMSLRPLILIPALLALGACDKQAPAPAPSDTPTPISTDWTTENPSDPAVPVNLPETKMKDVLVVPEASPSAPAK